MRCTVYKTKRRIRTLQFKGETGYTMSMTLFFATGNLHKKREMIELCGECGHDIVIPADKGIIFEPKESGSSFLENSLIKKKPLIGRSRSKSSGKSGAEPKEPQLPFCMRNGTI